MFRTAALISALILSTGTACATNAGVLQRNYSTQSHQLIICAFSSMESDADFSETQMKSVDWPDYLRHNVTITELSRGRITNHTPTILGPISNELQLTQLQRLNSASEYGCAKNENTVVFLGQDGIERGRWSRSVSQTEVFELIENGTASVHRNRASEVSR